MHAQIAGNFNLQIAILNESLGNLLITLPFVHYYTFLEDLTTGRSVHIALALRNLRYVFMLF